MRVADRISSISLHHKSWRDCFYFRKHVLLVLVPCGCVQGLTAIGTAEWRRFSSRGTQVWLISRPTRCFGQGGVMNTVELSARRLKYQLGFKDSSGFVVWLRPYFNKALGLFYGKRGLVRTIGGQEPFRLRPAYRNFKDDYECEVFKYLAATIKLVDV